MKLKPKAARRLLLVGVAGILLIGSAFALFFVRSWQNERRTQALRADGLAAYKQQDYPATLDNLGRYLRRKNDDREAWLAFGDARERIEEPRGGHLSQAALAYSRALAMDESDRATALKLVKIQNTIGYFAEARDQAMRLRPADPAAATEEHADAMMQEAIARIALKAWDPTLDGLTGRLVALKPRNYQAALMRATVLRESDRRDDARAFAAKLVADNPNDPGFAIVDLIVRVESGASVSIEDFAGALCRAAGLKVDPPARIAEPVYTEPQFAGQLFTGFDRLQMHPHALLVIRDAATRLKDPDFRRLLARREWESGQGDELLTDFPDPDTSIRGEHSEILAFRALTLRNLGRADEAKAIAAALRTRDRDFIARAWSNVLPAVIETTESKAALSMIDAAIKEHDAEPVFAFFRGEVLARLGRGDEARAAWDSVYKSGLAEGWETPAIRTAETLLDEGRLDEGLAAAQAALQRFRLAPSARLVHLRAQALIIESGRRVASPADVLKQLEETSDRIESLKNPTLSQIARRSLLPARVALLADAGRKSEAAALIEQAAADAQSLDPDLARRLAAVSAREGLNMEDRILSAASAGGGASGGTLLSRALLMAGAGKAQEAGAMIDEALAAAPADRKADMVLTRAQFRDGIDDPEALATWKAAVQAYPDSLAMHLAAIRSESGATDPAFIEHLAMRITQLGGSDADRPSADIRFARARALLVKSPTPRTRDEAVAILRALVLEAPARAEFRDALIKSLLLSDPERGLQPNFQGAIDQLTAGAAFSNDRATFTLRLASIYQQQGQTARAAEELSKLALDSAVDPAGRLQAVDRLAGLREHEAALRGLDAIAASPSAGEITLDLLLRRGGLLLALRRDREAVDTYQRILRMPLPSAQVILNVAGALRTLGESAGAEAAMARLDEPAIAPKDRALARATYAAGVGDAAAALAEYTRATELAPDDRTVWTLLTRFHLQRGELPQAEAAVSRGLERLPGDSELSILREQVHIASMDDKSIDVSALADALARNPATAKRAEAIRTIARAKADGTLDDAAAMARVADDFVDDPATQLFIARRLASGDAGSLAESVRIMRRAATRFANDPTVQEQAARTMITAEDWEPALAAATAWRALTRDPQADVAIAEAQLSLGRSRQAVDAVKDYRLPPTIEPSDAVSLGVLNVRTRSAAQSGNAAAALQLVEPYLASLPVVRLNIALPVAAMILKDPADVRKWIESIASRMDAAAINDQMALANAWATAAERLPASRTEFLRRASEITDRLIATETGATTQVFAMQSALLSAAGDVPGAIQAARRAVAKDPQSAAARTGLARLLMDTGKDYAEAESVALGVVAEGAVMPEALLIAAQAQLEQSDAAKAAGNQAAHAAKRKEAQSILSRLGAMQSLRTAMVLEMANLAERLPDDVLAMGLYERALTSPLPPTGMPLAIAKNNLAYLYYKKFPSGPANDTLRRAKSLIDEAITLAQLAPFYDTLGSIDAALGDRPAAIAAFRKAVEIDQNGVGAMVNLAAVLATGTAAEQAEAAETVKAVERLLTGGAKLDAEQQSSLDQTRQKLGRR